MMISYERREWDDVKREWGPWVSVSAETVKRRFDDCWDEVSMMFETRNGLVTSRWGSQYRIAIPPQSPANRSPARWTGEE